MGCKTAWHGLAEQGSVFLSKADIRSDYYMGLIMHTWEIHTLIFIPMNNFPSPRLV